MTFCLYRSNRVEKLAESLAEVVREPLQKPFARECIVVQGPGMERWLSARLASELSVWANPWFPFPRAVVELALDAALGPVPADEQVYEPTALTFLIARALEGELEDPALADVKRYLANDAHHDTSLPLCSLLAGIYDQYLVYRPELVLGWERGTDDHFQAKLWRAVTRNAPKTHVARRMEEFASALARGSALDRGLVSLPERVCLFGISTLPPAFLNVLTHLSERIDVHLFLLSPSPDYFGDFDRRLARGNSVRSLLANLGKMSRDFIELLLEGTPFVEPQSDLFELSVPTDLLSHLQRDIAELREREPTRGTADGPVPVRENDRSVTVHVCHSAIRELEVLRDELRARFEDDKTLEARDVVVFAPDIERYAPAIEAVFSRRGEDGRTSIPYRIADRKASRSSELLEAALALLDLLQSRLFLSDVLDFLHRPPVRTRFEIDESELELVQSWLVDAGARWALDGAHRATFGQPAYEENSFRFALHRLLVGYAAPDKERRSMLGVLPHSEIEGEQADLLGRLARFAESLFGLVTELAAPRSVEAWSLALIRALGRMLNDDAELGYEHQNLRAALADLAADARTGGFTADVGIQAVRRLLEERVDQGRANVGFLSGGVTFCEHVPMRAIPFRVVCMVGMDDESFPRRAPRPSFDLIAERERRGDRNVRDDDRQLFLEALLSARDALIITYIGRSAKDDGERPASVLVEQLLRVVDRHFVRAGADQSLCLDFEQKTIAASLTHVHALHRFDPRYFQGPHAPYFSYDERAAEASRAWLGETHALSPFVREPIAPRTLAHPTARFDLEDLVRFFRAPQRAFVQERLRVRLPRESEEVPDREPTALDALERFRLHDRLLGDLDRFPAEERLRILAQEGRLPPGTTGRVLFEDLQSNVAAMRSAVEPGAQLADRALSIRLPNATLTGRLQGIHEQARVEFTASAATEKHRLSTWIRHLALCASGPSPHASVLVARAGAKGKKGEVTPFHFKAVDDPLALLADLVDLYLLGMRMPLPFLREPASAYLDELAKSGDRAGALSRAVSKSRGPQQQGQTDLEDPYVRQVWSDEQLKQIGALSASDGAQQVTFAEVAERVLLPMRGHLTVEARGAGREANGETP